MATSVLCLVIPGDGFTSRFEDSIKHGCIPVVIQDTVWEKFEARSSVWYGWVQVARLTRPLVLAAGRPGRQPVHV